MRHLHPCPGCNRHIHTAESNCPFCGAEVAEALSTVPAPVLPTRRLGRAAIFTFAAASIGAASCGGSTEEGEPDQKNSASGGNDVSAGGELNMAAGGDGGGASALYGAAPAGAPNVGSGGTFGAAGGISAIYGVPPPGGTANMGGLPGSGGFPSSGGTVSTDAGDEGTDAGADAAAHDAAAEAGPAVGSGGGIAALYGAVPPYGIPAREDLPKE